MSLAQEPVFLKPGSIVVIPPVADLSELMSIATSFSDPTKVGNSYFWPLISKIAFFDILGIFFMSSEFTKKTFTEKAYRETPIVFILKG
jgi:hypothetical protein